MIRRYLLPHRRGRCEPRDRVCDRPPCWCSAYTHRQSSPNMPMAVAMTTQQAPLATADTPLVEAIRVFAQRLRALSRR